LHIVGFSMLAFTISSSFRWFGLTPCSSGCDILHSSPLHASPVKPRLLLLCRADRSDFFGREEDVAFLNHSWANQCINVVTIVVWAGVGKSALVNHWLQRMAAEDYRSAQLVFGRSFYRQGTSGKRPCDYFGAKHYWTFRVNAERSDYDLVRGSVVPECQLMRKQYLWTKQPALRNYQKT
jgi:hypothetical protein